MNIKVLGPGCSNCTKLEGIVKESVKELGVEAIVEKVTNPADFMTYGIMKTPGIVINEEVKSAGKVPSKEQVKKMIQDSMKN